MARKKKKPILVLMFKGLWWLVKGVFKLFYLALKYSFIGINALFKKAKKTKAVKTAKRKIISKKTPAIHSPLELVNLIKGNFIDFANSLHSESLVITIAGRRGSGKSALGFRIMENIHSKTKRPCYVLGVKQSLLPSWIESVDELKQVNNNGVVLVDEGAVAFSSRESMNKINRELGKLLAVARHKDLTLFLVTQNTGMIDKNVLNLTDTILLKEGSLLQEKMERSVIKELYQQAQKNLTTIPREKRKSHVYVFDSDFEGMIKLGLPSFWSTQMSKSQG